VREISGAIDLLPTLMQMTHLEHVMNKPLDGKSLLPLFSSEGKSWEVRNLYSIRKGKVSVRSQDFRLDEQGSLFNISEDRAQRQDVSKQYPKIKKELMQEARRFGGEMKTYSTENSHRPYTVGYAASTTLTARDGVSEGTIQRSSKSANNSFFKNWTDVQDKISWDVDIVKSGNYEVIIHYTCKESDVGAKIRLRQSQGDDTQVKIHQAFDPPLYSKAKERMEESHYFMKDFKPLSLGDLNLKKGRSKLILEAPEIPGDYAVDVIAIDLIRR
jgi:hypothetical protein